MMEKLTPITPEIHRLVVPFIDIYTTVHIVKTPDGDLLFDTATYPEDMDNYIFPALEELGVTAESLKYVFISHNHRDHAGGLGRFLEKYPKTCVLSRSADLKEKYSGYQVECLEDGAPILDILRIVTIPGHTMDCAAIYDTRSKTLLTGDCLQLYGIYGSGQWGANIGLPVLQIEAVEKLRTLDIETIVASHNYHPCDYMAKGRAQILRYFHECTDPLYRVRDNIARNPEASDEELTAQYNEGGKLPTMAVRITTAIRKAMAEGLM